jgi:hypothetical protein
MATVVIRNTKLGALHESNMRGGSRSLKVLVALGPVDRAATSALIRTTLRSVEPQGGEGDRFGLPPGGRHGRLRPPLLIQRPGFAGISVPSVP